MRHSGTMLLCQVLAPALLAATDPTGASADKTSPELHREIRALLPKFQPPAAPAVAATAPPAETPGPTDPNLLVLPKVVIMEPRPPGNDPDAWLTERAVQFKAMAAYQESMSSLEWMLNSWFVPIFSAPASARGRLYYESQKLAEEIDRLDNIINAPGLADPATAEKMRQALRSGNLPKPGKRISIGIDGH